jgi:hypothetical protein
MRVIIDLLTGGPAAVDDQQQSASAPASTSAAQPQQHSRWLDASVVRQLLGSGAGCCEPLRKALKCTAHDANAEVSLFWA